MGTGKGMVGPGVSQRQVALGEELLDRAEADLEFYQALLCAAANIVAVHALNVGIANPSVAVRPFRDGVRQVMKMKRRRLEN